MNASLASRAPSADLLRLYDRQLRAHIAPIQPAGVTVERDGPVVRTLGWGARGMVEYHDLHGLGDAEVDALIAREVAFFTERHQPFEWKLHGHDLPADLPDRLRAAGFVPEPTETVVIGTIADLTIERPEVEGVEIRRLRDRDDLLGIAALEADVWDEDRGEGWVDSLGAEAAADPDGIVIFVADTGGLIVSAGWIRFPAGTEFGTLWGGATRAPWRRRGIYRALVAERARLAAARGCRYLEVDASDDSRPILERLGFVPVTTTTPYIWSPRP